MQSAKKSTHVISGANQKGQTMIAKRKTILAAIDALNLTSYPGRGRSHQSETEWRDQKIDNMKTLLALIEDEQ